MLEYFRMVTSGVLPQSYSKVNTNTGIGLTLDSFIFWNCFSKFNEIGRNNEIGLNNEIGQNNEIGRNNNIARNNERAEKNEIRKNQDFVPNLREIAFAH